MNNRTIINLDAGLIRIFFIWYDVWHVVLFVTGELVSIETLSDDFQAYPEERAEHYQEVM